MTPRSTEAKHGSARRRRHPRGRVVDRIHGLAMGNKYMRLAGVFRYFWGWLAMARGGAVGGIAQRPFVAQSVAQGKDTVCEVKNQFVNTHLLICVGSLITTGKDRCMARRSGPSDRVVARIRRTKNQGPHAGTKAGDGWSRSPADELLLEMVTRLGVMTISQAHRYIYPRVSFDTARKRVGWMTEAGLLKKIDTLTWAGIIVYPTRNGRRAIFDEDSPLLAMETPADSTMVHRLMVTEEALKLVARGVQIITEREARLYEMGMTPEKIEDRDYFLADKGVRCSVNNSRGVVPTRQGTDYGIVDRFLIVPTPGAESQYRIPDLFEVTPEGELRAVEIEITQKRPARFKGILAAYREACVWHNPVPLGVEKTMREAGPLFRQLAGVRWVASTPVTVMLRGRPRGANPVHGQDEVGMVRALWSETVHTHLFYAKSNTWNLDKKVWPVSVTPLDVSHDPGLEYAVHQMLLPSSFQVSMREWQQWRKIWEKDVEGDDNPVKFLTWLRAPSNRAKVLREGRGKR